MTQATDGAAERRMKWNDIRIIGPLLVAMFAAVTFMSPNFVGAANGVGVEGCFDRSVVSTADLADEGDDLDEPKLIRWTGVDCPMPCEYYNSAAVIITGPDGDCCIDDVPLVGGGFPPCPDPEPDPEPETDGDGAEGEDEEEEPETVTSAPARKLVAPPDPIEGPIWLGATQVDASVPGLVTLTFPDLLAAFIEDNIVRVYDADGVRVYEGRIGADGTILVFSDNAPMRIKTILTTGALYFETVGASTTP